MTFRSEPARPCRSSRHMSAPTIAPAHAAHSRARRSPRSQSVRTPVRGFTPRYAASHQPRPFVGWLRLAGRLHRRRRRRWLRAAAGGRSVPHRKPTDENAHRVTVDLSAKTPSDRCRRSGGVRVSSFFDSSQTRGSVSERQWRSTRRFAGCATSGTEPHAGGTRCRRRGLPAAAAR
jgi:hypothetical protein